MINKKISLIGCLGLLLVLMAFTYRSEEGQPMTDISDDTGVWSVMEELGRIRINQVNSTIEGVSADRGRELVLEGQTTGPDGKKTSVQSPYFKCTACHTADKEFEDLADITAQKKLDYAVKNDLPFLQGSTFYGIVNRKHFYNDDYQKKYAGVPLIKESYTDIRAAIQLCATQCSQGRMLEDWEMESILAYFWTLELKVKDLNLTAAEKESINAALKGDGDEAQALQTIENHYINISPAHFAEKDLEYKKLSDAEMNDAKRFNNGKEIYNRSCIHCHGNQQYSFFNLDHSQNTFKFLRNKTKKGSFFSIFKITRHGTYSLNGKKAYMPQYPIEKLSDAQLVDLQIYVENMAKGNNLQANAN